MKHARRAVASEVEDADGGWWLGGARHELARACRHWVGGRWFRHAAHLSRAARTACARILRMSGSLSAAERGWVMVA